MQLAAKPEDSLQPGPTLVARGVMGAGLVATARFANDAVTSMLPALLPSFGVRLALEPTELALLAGSFAVSTALPQPYFGALADRFGAYRVGAVGLAVSALSTFAVATASTAPALWLALLVGGLGSSALHPAGIGLARSAATRRPGLAVALFSAAGMAGIAAGPLLALWLSTAWGPGGLAVAAVPAFLVAALFFRFAPRTRATGRAAAVPAAALATSQHLVRSLTGGPLLKLALVGLSTNLVMLAFSSAVPLWLIERGVAETSPLLGWTLATFSLASALGGLAGGMLGRSSWNGAAVALSLGLALPALLAVLSLSPGSAGYFMAVAAAGGLLYVHAPLVMVRAQELAPGSESAVSGLMLGGTSAVAGAAYAGLGVVQSTFGLANTLSVVFALVLPAAYFAVRALESGREQARAGVTTDAVIAPWQAPCCIDTSCASCRLDVCALAQQLSCTTACREFAAP